ncbi:MAG: DUF1015 family protein [Micromonosporaceae bacterium]|nr:DUF1015 family protein [Micromonosporaceae bacterium]
MTLAHPIARAWLSTGGTGARNYDEFADESEITRIIEANPASALAIEMPHRAPASLGRPFDATLPDAAARLAETKAAGRYRPYEQIAGVYRIGGSSYGVWTMVDTNQISTSAAEPGLVIRNEDVFPEKVRERVALASAIGHLLSPVLLLQTGQGAALHAALRDAAEAAGPPSVRDMDEAGRVHEVWALPPGPTQDRILALAGGGELVVADGNHRSLAAQTAGLARFLAVVTTPASVTIEPYHRLVTELPVPADQLPQRLAAAGAVVQPLADVTVPAGRGTIIGYAAGAAWSAQLPVDPSASEVENLDHALVERVLLGEVLGLEPGDKRITYVGGDNPPRWLAEQVDTGRAELAVLIAPVSVADFIAVNLARHKLPRKSTWFMPKARAGLVVAELGSENGGR